MVETVSTLQEIDGVQFKVKTRKHEILFDYDKAVKDPYEYFKETREGYELEMCKSGEHIHIIRPDSRHTIATVAMNDGAPLSEAHIETVRQSIAPKLAKDAAVTSFWFIMENIQQGFERMSRQNDELAAELRELKDHIACLPPNGGGHSYRFASVKFGLDGITKKRTTRMFHSRGGYQSE